MSISIKKRIYWSFLLLVSIFVLNGSVTIGTLRYNERLSRHVIEVVDPSLQSIYDFRKLLLQSEMFATNWVFFRYSQEDKKNLVKLHNSDYPDLKKKLSTLSSGWYDRNMTDSLKKLFVGFEQLLNQEKYIMGSLKQFDDYNDPVKKLSAEETIENKVLPITSTLMNSLDRILKHEENAKTLQEAELEKSSMFLKILISCLAITIICIGLFLAVYMTRKIIKPINKIRHLVNDLGIGIIRKTNQEVNGDEIGEMIRSVNNLSEKLLVSASFAREIGKRNFNIPFNPLSNEDELGKALITMRDNLKSSDERLNEAQHLAHLGNFEIDMITNVTTWSDEVYKMYGINKDDLHPSVEIFLSFIHPDDREYAKASIDKTFVSLTGSSFSFRFIRKNGIVAHGYTEWKFGFDETGKPMRLYGIIMDITERIEAEEMLRVRNAELTKTNMELDKFVYSVSHDLRAPLSSMLGVVEISEEETQDATMLEHLNMLKGSITKLDGFIQDILNYSRNTRLEIRKEEINFKEMLHDIIGNLQYMKGSEHRIKINTHVSDHIHCISDKSRLSIVLNNLISNAIRYQNPSNGEPVVNIAVDTSDTDTHIVVKDNGIGISKELQDKIFEMFFRVSENSVGSGLGLYIVKETVCRLNGSIEVKSELGKGSAFSIHIPNN